MALTLLVRIAMKLINNFFKQLVVLWGISWRWPIQHAINDQHLCTKKYFHQCFTESSKISIKNQVDQKSINNKTFTTMHFLVSYLMTIFFLFREHYLVWYLQFLPKMMQAFIATFNTNSHHAKSKHLVNIGTMQIITLAQKKQGTLNSIS